MEQLRIDISGANILVTGGAGMIGLSTVELLLGKCSPAGIVVLDDLVRGSISSLARAKDDPRLSFVLGDICDADTVARLIHAIGRAEGPHDARVPTCGCTNRPNVTDSTSGGGRYTHLRGGSQFTRRPVS